MTIAAWTLAAFEDRLDAWIAQDEPDAELRTLVTALLVAPAGSQTEWVDYFLSPAPLPSPLLVGLMESLGIFSGGLIAEPGLLPE